MNSNAKQFHKKIGCILRMRKSRVLRGYCYNAIEMRENGYSKVSKNSLSWAGWMGRNLNISIESYEYYLG